MNTQTTHLYNIEELDEALIESTIKEIYEALKEKGYNPINQIVGYLISSDPGYISSHKDARKKIKKIDRTKLLEMLLKNYIGEDEWDI